MVLKKLTTSIDAVSQLKRTGTVNAGFAPNAVNNVSFLDAMRFTNWLHNGQPSGNPGMGTTESGAYSIGTGLDELASERYQPGDYHYFTIREPKERRNRPPLLRNFWNCVRWKSPSCGQSQFAGDVVCSLARFCDRGVQLAKQKVAI